MLYWCVQHWARFGPLAQLARASGLHPEGHRFEPGRAHKCQGPEAVSFRPLSVCFEECARRASVLLLVLIGDIFTDDELAGCARAELLQGEAAHQLLVGGRALGACAGEEAEEPADERAHL